MSPQRTFYLVPADVVARPTVAIPHSLAPSPRIFSSTVSTTTIQPSRSSPKRPVSVSSNRSLSADLKRPLSADPIEVLLGDNTQPHQRKRECLDHLTHEQKMNRRKMKNRIAAQTARDRKKYRSQRLEDVVRELLEQNEILRQENEILQTENRELAEQNRSLIARLEGASEAIACRVGSEQPAIFEEIPCDVVTSEKSGTAVESAAFISGLLPRVQSDELEEILNDFADENLEFDLDQLVEQLPEEEQLIVQPTTIVDLCQSSSSSSGIDSPVDESLLKVPRCSPQSASYPSPSSNSGQLDELTLFEEQKLLDDPMLSSPSDWPCDNALALSPFSDSFQREFFQMLE